MTHGSLFSGIGGFDLAAQKMGWKNVFHCEWNPFGQKILKYYWPEAISYEDITKTDFSIHRGTIDILTGGFPCQPYSDAGKRLGKEDERHLWPEMRRAYNEIQPNWIVGENVRGLVNWNEGMVFHEVQSELEADGYEVFPFLLPAAGVNAPHERYRIFFVAHSSGDGHQPRMLSEDRCSPRESEIIWDQRQRIWTDTGGIGEQGDATNTNCNERRKRRLYTTECETSERHSCSCNACCYKRKEWENFPTQPPVCNGDDGISARLDGITFSKWRNESIKAGGNAVVHQVVLQIFKAIQEYETNPRPN